MRIESIETTSVAGIPDRLWRFSDKQGLPTSTMIVGRTAKTSLLRLVATLIDMVGPYGAPPGPILRRFLNGPKARVTAIFRDEDAEVGRFQVTLDEAWNPSRCDDNARAVLSRRGEGGFAFLGAPRISTGTAIGQDPNLFAATGGTALYDEALHELGTTAAVDGSEAVEHLRRSGFVTAIDRPDRLAAVKASIAERSPSVRLLGIERTPLGFSARMVHASSSLLDLEGLSRQERDVVLTALAVRALNAKGGLVAIDDGLDHVTDDDVDAHWSWLHRLTDDAQLIVTSRLPRRVSRLQRMLVVEAP